MERFRGFASGRRAAESTVVWLPTFFSHSRQSARGELVILEHILDGDARKYLGHLRVEDQATTRADLSSLGPKRNPLISARWRRRTASQWRTTALFDQSRTVEEHFIPLLGDLDIRAVLAGTMKDGIRQVIDTMLSKKYPHHPRFDGPVSVTRMERVGALVDRCWTSESDV